MRRGSARSWPPARAGSRGPRRCWVRSSSRGTTRPAPPIPGGGRSNAPGRRSRRKGCHRRSCRVHEFASALLRAGRPDEARDQLRLVLAEAPDPEAYWLLSRADLQRKDWAAARADSERSGSFRVNDPMRPEPAPYVGAASCAGCHAAEFQAQQASRHARTFVRESEIGDLSLPRSTVPDRFDRSGQPRPAPRRATAGSARRRTWPAGSGMPWSSTRSDRATAG